MDHLEEQALLGFARNDHWSIVATLEHEPAQTQIETASQLLTLAMTIETMRLEDRTNVFFKDGRRSAESRCGTEHRSGNQPRMREKTTDEQ